LNDHLLAKDNGQTKKVFLMENITKISDLLQAAGGAA
jgi:hypothetical protein